ncbi:hypothetical protein B0G38_001188 [Arthrobacter sp. VKM Ac-2550]|nr:hypothetical protein [Arthrobacter sp. VKM Ac-2550]
MWPARPLPSVEAMEHTRKSSLQWPLIFGLGALGLIHPLTHMTGVAEALGVQAVAPVLILAIALAWILIVGLGNVGRPVLTLVLAGVTYAVYLVVISALLTPILTGELQGPLAMPFVLIPLVLTNAFYGLVAGLLAWGVQGLRRVRTGQAGEAR